MFSDNFEVLMINIHRTAEKQAITSFLIRQFSWSVRSKTKQLAQFRFECNVRAEFITPSCLRKYGTQWFKSTVETRFSSLIHDAG